MTRSRGIALISVLMITVVVSALAYHLVSRHAMTIAATRVHFETSRIREFNLATEQFAITLLRRDWLDTDSREYDSLDEDWAQPNSIQFDEGELHFVIVDSKSKLNLNSASRPGATFAVQSIENLFLNLDFTPGTSGLWVDWIDSDLEPTPSGAEDFNWMVHEPPMRTPNNPVTDVSEVRTLLALSRDQFRALRQLATVLPVADSKVNINTVLPDVLKAMDETLSPFTLEQLSSETRLYVSVDRAVGALPELARLVERIDVKTEFFEVQSTITIGERRSDYVCHLYRNPETGEITVYERDFGVKVERDRFPEVFASETVVDS